MKNALKIGTGIIGGGAGDPYPGVTVYDTFTDADSTVLTSHVPNKAPASWAHINGTFQITSNRCAMATTGSPAMALAAIESGKADCVITAVIKRTAAGYVGLAVRVIDINNYLLVVINNTNQFQVIRKFEGSIGVVASTAFTNSANTDYPVQVTLSGTSIVAVINGTTTINTTYANLTAATKHGFYNEVAGNFDNFQVV